MLKYYVALSKGLIGAKKTDSVLYVGASHGKTVKKLSKECKVIYALDISKTTTKELVNLAEKHDNIAPILADANNVESYKNRIEKVDFLFQDIAQIDQVRIFKKLIKEFKPKKAWLSLKTKGIDSRKTKEEVLKEAKKEFINCKIVDLAPEIKDHYVIQYTND